MRAIFHSVLTVLVSVILISCSALSSKAPQPTAILAQTTAPEPSPFPQAIRARQLQVITRENAQAVTMLGFRGRGKINGIAWSPDGAQIAVAASTGIFIIDTATFAETRLPGSRPANSIAYSPDAARLAAAEGDVVTVWDVAGGKALRTFHGHTDDVISVAFSPDGNMVASTSVDQSIRLWDAASGQERFAIKDPALFSYQVTFSPDGRLLLSNAYQRGSRLWDVASGQEVRALNDDGPFTFSPDGTTLTSGSRTLTEEVFHLSDVASGEVLRTMKGTADQSASPHLFSGDQGQGITRVNMLTAYSPGGTVLASTSWADSSLKLWDTSSGRELRRLNGDANGQYHLAFSPDGTRLASASFTSIKIWEVASGQEIRTLTGRPEEPEGREPGMPEGYGDGAACLAFSPDGTVLAACTYVGPVKLFEVSTGKLLAEIQTDIGIVNSVTFSPDGKRIAAGGGIYMPVERGVQVWDAETYKQLLKINDFDEAVNSIAFHPDGAVLAVGWGNAWGTGGVKLWNAATGAFLTEFGLQMQPGRAPLASVDSIAFNADGSMLAVANTSGKVLLWDMVNGKEHSVLEPSIGRLEMKRVAFSPHGTMLAAAGYTNSPDTSSLRIWDIANGKERMVLEGHQKDVISVVFHPDGKVLASASYDETVRLWDVETGITLAVLTVPAVSTVAISPDGKLLATSGWDGAVRLWGVLAHQ